MKVVCVGGPHDGMIVRGFRLASERRFSTGIFGDINQTQTLAIYHLHGRRYMFVRYEVAQYRRPPKGSGLRSARGEPQMEADGFGV